MTRQTFCNYHEMFVYVCWFLHFSDLCVFEPILDIHNPYWLHNFNMLPLVGVESGCVWSCFTPTTSPRFPLESRRSGSNGQAPSSERVAYTGKERRLSTKCLLHTLNPPPWKKKKQQQHQQHQQQQQQQQHHQQHQHQHQHQHQQQHQQHQQQQQQQQQQKQPTFINHRKNNTFMSFFLDPKNDCYKRWTSTVSRSQVPTFRVGRSPGSQLETTHDTGAKWDQPAMTDVEPLWIFRDVPLWSDW